MISSYYCYVFLFSKYHVNYICYFFIYIIMYPIGSICMVYLPTLTININHSCRWIYQSHGSVMGYRIFIYSSDRPWIRDLIESGPPYLCPNGRSRNLQRLGHAFVVTIKTQRIRIFHIAQAWVKEDLDLEGIYTFSTWICWFKVCLTWFFFFTHVKSPYKPPPFFNGRMTF